MAAHAGNIDLIIDTVAASHDLDAYTTSLAIDGTIVLIGVPEPAHPSPDVGNLIGGRRSVAGTLNGGIAETQEMLDFCAAHGITADIETIAADGIEAGSDRMKRGDVKYRFVVDNATLAN
jgi:uncharacterized zinc-type alcohol dehydrogenase-like protein